MILKKLRIKKRNSGCSVGQTWSTDQSEGFITSFNPSTEEPLASVYRSSAQDYARTIKTARAASDAWRTMPAPKRGEIIHALGMALREHKDALGTLVSLETGKSKQEGDGEVQEMIDMADFAVGQSRMLYGYTMQSERPSHRMYEQWHPLGVVGIITAFNFPVAVWAWNAFLAVICGNAVIWKPSPKTPLCAIAIQHLCNDVMREFDIDGIFSLWLSEDPLLLKQMVEDPCLDLISFTGSSAVGREINMMVAKRFGRVLLELSGNNAIIVDQTANLKLALPAIVFGAIGTAGQRCTTTRRLFVHDSIYNACRRQLVDAYRHIKIGDPLNEKNHMGPLIDENAVKQFEKTVQAAKAQGGRVLVGGSRLKRRGFFVEPTIIEADNAWDVVQHETFAPILYLMRYTHLDDAIQMQNHSAFGLSSALFTQHLQQAEFFLSVRGSDCGIANINIGTSGAEIGGAFGGEKATGGGREAGSDAWRAYMRRQTNTINWGNALTLAQGIKFDL